MFGRFNPSQNSIITDADWLVPGFPRAVQRITHGRIICRVVPRARQQVSSTSVSLHFGHYPVSHIISPVFLRQTLAVFSRSSCGSDQTSHSSPRAVNDITRRFRSRNHRSVQHYPPLQVAQDGMKIIGRLRAGSELGQIDRHTHRQAKQIHGLVEQVWAKSYQMPLPGPACSRQRFRTCGRKRSKCDSKKVISPSVPR